MYSILLKLENITADRWKYLTDTEGEVITFDTLTDVQDKVVELLQTKTLSQIKVVKNCIITNNVTVEEVEID